MILWLLACSDGGEVCDDPNEACDPDTCADAPTGPEMLPGSDCLGCHTDEAVVPTELAWTAAGTVYVDPEGTAPAEGVVVRITDAEGKVVQLGTNAVGNFYTFDTLVPPISAEVEGPGGVLAMTGRPTITSCNQCHACDGAAGGKLYTP